MGLIERVRKTVWATILIKPGGFKEKTISKQKASEKKKHFFLTMPFNV